ncbi:tagaturonate reductase [Cohnella cholangitidis]|uniref:Tagaturonate reductase n=1 Tax=Cohnella cholangitidis TaxID=2598458 RepID=A0A7G5BSQ3_9BACL|nr:tagaturonate reductase [Cohnella cholangitidis]QMV39987.1 tagaturonate reductase [Cohnella cholangitidis]
MRQLNRSALQDEEAKLPKETSASPVTVLQIGEGNFLRGFFDWMVHESRKQGLFQGSVAVTQPRPSGKPKIDALAGQDGLYTLVIRGLENGASVERKEVISVFSEAFDPYGDWARMVELAVSPELRFIVSNTTEAGLVYRPEELTEGAPIVSFPGKVAYLLYRRYLKFDGAADRGLILLPCELLERNGDALKEAVLKYATDWELPETFVDWVQRHNRFLNSLVDRIVTGYPDRVQAEQWFAEWGYEDGLLCTAEPYHLWAIEGEPELDEELPFNRSGLNVQWVEDLKPFQQRKVRILNGAHTLMTPIGILHGVEHVRELMEHEKLGAFVRSTVYEEIIPSLPYPAREMRDYADAVFERYLNPYIRHRLADIAMNSISKFKTRLIPSLSYYAQRGERVPTGLAQGLAGLVRYYHVKRNGDQFEGRSLSGQPYTVRDDAKVLDTLAGIWADAEHANEALIATVTRILSDETLWGEDLARWNGLASEVTETLAGWTAKEEQQ